MQTIGTAFSCTLVLNFLASAICVGASAEGLGGLVRLRRGSRQHLAQKPKGMAAVSTARLPSCLTARLSKKRLHVGIGAVSSHGSLGGVGQGDEDIRLVDDTARLVRRLR